MKSLEGSDMLESCDFSLHGDVKPDLYPVN